MTRWQRGTFCITSMFTATDVLGWADITGLTPTVIVGVSVILLFYVRPKKKTHHA